MQRECKQKGTNKADETTVHLDFQGGAVGRSEAFNVAEHFLYSRLIVASRRVRQQRRVLQRHLHQPVLVQDGPACQWWASRPRDRG